MSNKKSIILPDAARQQLEAERFSQIDSHLEQLGNQVSVQNQTLDIVLAAALAQGIPDDPNQAAFVARCVGLADVIAAHKLRRFNEGVREVIKLLNVHNLPPHVEWAARRAGVELLEPVPDNH